MVVLNFHQILGIYLDPTVPTSNHTDTKFKILTLASPLE